MSSLFTATRTKDEALQSMDEAYTKSKELHILQFLKDQKQLQRRLEMCQFRSDNVAHQSGRRESVHRLRPLTAQPRRTSSESNPSEVFLGHSLSLRKGQTQIGNAVTTQLLTSPHDGTVTKLYTNGDVIHRESQRPESARDLRASWSAEEELGDTLLDHEVDLDALSVTSVRSASPTWEDLEISDDVPSETSARKLSHESSILQGNSAENVTGRRHQVHLKRGRRSLVGVPNVNRTLSSNSVSVRCHGRDYVNFADQESGSNGGGGSTRPRRTFVRHQSAPTDLHDDEILSKLGKLGVVGVGKRNVFSAHEPLPPVQSAATVETDATSQDQDEQ